MWYNIIVGIQTLSCGRYSPQTLATGSVSGKQTYSEDEPVLDHCEPVRKRSSVMAVHKLSDRRTLVTKNLTMLGITTKQYPLTEGAKNG